MNRIDKSHPEEHQNLKIADGIEIGLNPYYNSYNVIYFLNKSLYVKITVAKGCIYASLDQTILLNVIKVSYHDMDKILYNVFKKLLEIYPA